MDEVSTARVLNVKEIYRGRVIRLFSERVALPNGFTADLDVIRHPGASAILPLLEDGQVLLVCQYRHAAGGYLWEVPAGTLADGESPIECARREIREEAGYEATRLTRLGEIVPVPGYSDERIHLFLARGLKPSKQNLDEDEVLHIGSFPLNEAMEMVRRGEIQDGKTICCLFMAYTEVLDGTESFDPLAKGCPETP